MFFPGTTNNEAHKSKRQRLLDSPLEAVAIPSLNRICTFLGYFFFLLYNTDRYMPCSTAWISDSYVVIALYVAKASA
jgi:hypothetical protein